MKKIKDITDLELMADKLRIESIMSTTAAGSGHPTSCMSCAEIMSTLFFDVIEKDDEFILSKGHAAPILWAALSEAGHIPIKELAHLRKINSDLEGHPTPRMPMIKVATGSLGQGLGAGVGMALAKKIQNNRSKVYVLMGDGETAEGSVWEAANTASIYHLKNLVAIVDVNRLGQSGQTMHGHDVQRYKQKFRAFGWNTITINGHSVMELRRAFKKARKSKKPFAILAETFKGHGFPAIEDKNGWHGKPFPPEMMEKAIKKIGSPDIKLKSNIRHNKVRHEFKGFKSQNYNLDTKVSTRAAFGEGLVLAGRSNDRIVAIDGDVKNSSMTLGFFKEFPRRSFETFIAEQCMAGMAIGFSAQGFIPVVSTFAAFLTRAHDFIRMAMYSGSNIKFVGSHVGVSIGEDGSSQMGLEDIPMFYSMPGSIIQYPCDGVSAQKCFSEQLKYEGISYLRTTREKTPVIYKNTEAFPAGKFKILRKSNDDKVLVIGAGITVHEALKAHDELKKKRTHIRVIDLYSIKPIDKAGLKKHAKECNGKVIVVEDHYEGGIGNIVSSIVGPVEHLYIKKIPRSGRPQQLRAKFGIDSDSIIRAVKKLKNSR